LFPAAAGRGDVGDGETAEGDGGGGEFKIGCNLCGHPGKVHGGVTATAFDTTFGWSCYLTGQKEVQAEFPIQFFTANLEVNYRTPVPCGETLVLHTRQVGREGRKLWLEGVATDAEGKLKYADASALFIEVAPKEQSAG